MTNSQRLAQVRDFFVQWLLAHGETPAERLIRNESILIRDGYYCGRRFQAAGHHAVWFMEEDQLKIHESDSGVVAVFSGEELSDASIFAASELEAQKESSPLEISKEPIAKSTEESGERTDDHSVVSIDTPVNDKTDDDKPDEGETTKKAA